MRDVDADVRKLMDRLIEPNGGADLEFMWEEALMLYPPEYRGGGVTVDGRMWARMLATLGVLLHRERAREFAEDMEIDDE